MILQIKKHGSEDWGTIRSTSGIGLDGDKAHKYLMGQQNDWIQNGGPEYVSAEYRIGEWRRYRDGPFVVYTPMIQRSFES